MTTTEPTILLIEDNRDDEDLTFLALKEANVCYRVVVCRNGADALDYLFCQGSHEQRSAEYNPGLVLLDLKLPKLDGLEVLRRIRSHPATKLIPVVILSTSMEEGDVFESYTLCANSYIRKPVEFEKFASVIKQISSYWFDLNVPAPKKEYGDD
jgi:two-component system, response regulator